MSNKFEALWPRRKRGVIPTFEAACYRVNIGKEFDELLRKKTRKRGSRAYDTTVTDIAQKHNISSRSAERYYGEYKKFKRLVALFPLDDGALELGVDQYLPLT